MPCRSRLFAFFVAMWGLQNSPTVEADKSEEVDAEQVWEGAGIWEIYEFLKCDDYRQEGEKLEVHSMETWTLLQRTYADLVDEEINSLPEGVSIGLDGFYVKYNIDHGEFGRGIFAAEDIPKGNLIWKSFNTAQFDDPAVFRQYLRTLPKNLACDVIHWAYVRYNEDDDVVICVDLDPGSFTNACVEDSECNMVLDEEMKDGTGCNVEFYAGRDIPLGEELRIDYEFSVKDEGWSILGLWRGYGMDAEEAQMFRQARQANRWAKEAARYYQINEEEYEQEIESDGEDDDDDEEEEEEEEEDFESWPTRGSVRSDEL